MADIRQIVRKMSHGVLAALWAQILTGCASHYRTGIEGGQTLTPPSNFTVIRDIRYTPSDWAADLRADLYLPGSTDRGALKPAILVIHGGSWNGKDRRDQIERTAKNLARRGYIALNLTYRTTPEWQYPAPLEDLKQAVKWLQANTETYPIDPHRIGVWGYSAGAHLATLLGLKPETTEGAIKAIVSGGNPANLMLYPGGKLVPMFLGGTRDVIPERFREASPVNHVTEQSPPTFVYHGQWDRLVPPEHAKQFIRQLEAHGVPHEVYWLNFRGHALAYVFEGSSETAAINFLDGVLRTESESSNWLRGIHCRYTQLLRCWCDSEIHAPEQIARWLRNAHTHAVTPRCWHDVLPRT